MELSGNNTPTIEQLANAYTQLQNQFNATQQQLAAITTELNGTRSELTATKQLLSARSDSSSSMIRPKKPETFSGHGSIRSWITHVTNYVGSNNTAEALKVAVSYLSGSAHEWWLVYKETEEGRQVRNWNQLQQALIRRFETLNKSKIARDKLARWKQVNNVPSFNEEFQRILLDIPNITVEEQLDRYARGLKSYIWKELCTKEYNSLSVLMKDAESIEIAHQRHGNSDIPVNVREFIDFSRPLVTQQPTTIPVPMDIGYTKIMKLSSAERDHCRREGRCFRCRQKGHNANMCPRFSNNQ